MLIVVLALLTASAQALEVQQTLWGFDGRVVPDRFNPISVLVSNPGNLAFDGALTLLPESGSPGGGGVNYVQPVFLAPRTSRWVQFYVQTGSSVGRYSLRWGRGAKDGFDFDETVNTGAPACVWLRDLDSPFIAGATLKSFPDLLFPTTAVGADGLDAVVLDHVPKWEAARREAFLDWVKLGGTVHLLPAADGSLPIFGEDLKELDSKEEVTRIGAGRVVHHTVSARDISAQYLAERGYPARTLEPTKTPIVYDMDSTFFRDLSSLTRPKVTWPLINFLMIAYVIIIGPIHNYYRRRLDYRVSIAAFLGCVAIFGLALGIAGRRGYGESQTVHSLGIARSLGGGKVDVTQWVSAFATSGDRYDLTHRASVNLYAPDRFAEAGSGLIFNGKDGHIVADVPLYSARSFLHRAIMMGDDTSVTVEKWSGGPTLLKELRLKVGPGFPKVTGDIRAIHGGQIYEIELRNGALELKVASQGLPAYFSTDKLNSANYQNFSASDNPSTAEVLRLVQPVLAARAIRQPGIFPTTISAPKERADMQLLITAPAPPSMHLQGKGFAREDGWVLYVQDVYKP